MKLVILAAAVFTTATAAIAKPTYRYPEYVGSRELYDDCRSGGAFCAGYVAAIADFTWNSGQFSVANGSHGNAADACIPYGIKLQQLIDVVTHYLEKNDLARQKSGDVDVVAAMEQAFPCQ